MEGTPHIPGGSACASPARSSGWALTIKVIFPHSELPSLQTPSDQMSFFPYCKSLYCSKGNMLKSKKPNDSFKNSNIIKVKVQRKTLKIKGFLILSPLPPALRGSCFPYQPGQVVEARMGPSVHFSDKGTEGKPDGLLLGREGGLDSQPCSRPMHPLHSSFSHWSSHAGTR